MLRGFAWGWRRKYLCESVRLGKETCWCKLGVSLGRGMIGGAHEATFGYIVGILFVAHHWPNYVCDGAMQFCVGSVESAFG